MICVDSFHKVAEGENVMHVTMYLIDSVLRRRLPFSGARSECGVERAEGQDEFANEETLGGLDSSGVLGRPTVSTFSLFL